MGRYVMVSSWCVSTLRNTRFCFLYFRMNNWHAYLMLYQETEVPDHLRFYKSYRWKSTLPAAKKQCFYVFCRITNNLLQPAGIKLHICFLTEPSTIFLRLLSVDLFKYRRPNSMTWDKHQLLIWGFKSTMNTFGFLSRNFYIQFSIIIWCRWQRECIEKLLSGHKWVTMQWFQVTRKRQVGPKITLF